MKDYLLFDKKGFGDYLHWQNQDRKIMKKINLIILITLFFIFPLSAKEKIIPPENYPEWSRYVLSSEEFPEWKVSHFWSDEVLEKVTQKGGKIIFYSKTEMLSFQRIFDKKGHAVKTEASYLSDGSFAINCEYSRKAPFGRKYCIDRIVNDDGSEYFLETWYDKEGRESKTKSEKQGEHIFSYNDDGSYTETCTKSGTETDLISSNAGAIQNFSKDGNLLSIFSNDKNNFKRYFPESDFFQNLVKDYDLEVPKSSDIFICLDTYFDNFCELYFQTWDDGKMSEQKFIFRGFLDGGWRIYNKDGNLIHAKDDDDEYWYEYDEKGNVAVRKESNYNTLYVSTFEYDDKNRLIYDYTKELDKNGNQLAFCEEFLAYDDKDDENFATSVKWKTEKYTDWFSQVNGYVFQNIENNTEYKFEKISDTQMKMIPQNGEPSFVMEKEN